MFQARNQLFVGGGLIPSPSFSFALPFLPSPFSSSFPFPSPFPSPPFPALPLKSSSGERCKFSQRVRAELGRQTHFGAVEGQNFANHVNKLACSHASKYYAPLCSRDPGTPWTPFWLPACIQGIKRERSSDQSLFIPAVVYLACNLVSTVNSKKKKNPD